MRMYAQDTFMGRRGAGPSKLQTKSRVRGLGSAQLCVPDVVRRQKVAPRRVQEAPFQRSRRRVRDGVEDHVQPAAAAAATSAADCAERSGRTDVLVEKLPDLRVLRHIATRSRELPAHAARAAVVS